jgi:hypothetical protein
MTWVRSLAISALLFSSLSAGDVTVAGILSKVQAIRAAMDFRAAGRLVRVSKSNGRKPYQIALKGKCFRDALRMFIEVIDPPPARVRIMLRIDPAGKAQIYTGHAGEPAPKELPFEKWGERFLDSDLSYEDLLENFLLWQVQSLVRQEKFGARECYLIKSEPGASNKSHYSSVLSWLDQEILYPVKIEKEIKATGDVKEILYHGLRESRGLWSASQIEVRRKNESDSTLLIFNRGSARAKLALSDFSPDLLVQPGSK